jgi:hypothetical protein
MQRSKNKNAQDLQGHKIVSHANFAPFDYCTSCSQQKRERYHVPIKLSVLHIYTLYTKNFHTEPMDSGRQNGGTAMK